MLGWLQDLHYQGPRKRKQIEQSVASSNQPRQLQALAERPGSGGTTSLQSQPEQQLVVCNSQQVLKPGAIISQALIIPGDTLQLVGSLLTSGTVISVQYLAGQQTQHHTLQARFDPILDSQGNDVIFFELPPSVRPPCFIVANRADCLPFIFSLPDTGNLNASGHAAASTPEACTTLTSKGSPLECMRADLLPALTETAHQSFRGQGLLPGLITTLLRFFSGEGPGRSGPFMLSRMQDAFKEVGGFPLQCNGCRRRRRLTDADFSYYLWHWCKYPIKCDLSEDCEADLWLFGG
ncbi:hypothetical protein WJX73_004375 [Symbiochloris irregularis]|uniref:Uncharacterized protein n=1 Tax=Symbiochloris irregularis TaxID=706552 RepID=A0AAW1NN21_9CHLO